MVVLFCESRNEDEAEEHTDIRGGGASYCRVSMLDWLGGFISLK